MTPHFQAKILRFSIGKQQKHKKLIIFAPGRTAWAPICCLSGSPVCPAGGVCGQETGAGHFCHKDTFRPFSWSISALLS